MPSDRLRGEAIHYLELSIICVRELFRGMIARSEGGLSWFDFLQGKAAKAAHDSGKAQELDLR